jgi:uncharacterized membrane protein
MLVSTADARPASPEFVLRATRAAVLALLAALIVLGLAWELWLAPTGSRALALKVLPLALPLGGVLSLRQSSYRALRQMVWLYDAEGALRATTERGAAMHLAWIELLLCAALFAACVLHIRSRAQAAAAS